MMKESREETREVEAEKLKDKVSDDPGDVRARMIDDALMFGVPDEELFWQAANDLIPQMIERDVMKRLGEE